MCGVCERHAKDLQHFISASFQLHVMLHDGNQAVGAYGSVNLYSNSGWKALLVPVKGKYQYLVDHPQNPKELQMPYQG